MGAEERCAAHLAEAHPADTARRLETIPVPETVAFLNALQAKVAAGVLGAAGVWVGPRWLHAMTPERAAELLDTLSPETALRTLRPLNRDTRARILQHCSAVVRRRLERQLRYRPGTVGAVMDPLVLALPEDMAVEDAVKELKRAPNRVYYYLYVLNDDDRLVGVLDIRELVAAPAKERLTAVMKRDVIGVSPESELTALLTHSAWGDVDALPVVDRARGLLGLIRHRTVRKSAGATSGTGVGGLGPTVVALAQLYWDTVAMMVNAAAGAWRAAPTSASRGSS